jgi:hypothetical protein
MDLKMGLIGRKTKIMELRIGKTPKKLASICCP